MATMTDSELVRYLLEEQTKLRARVLALEAVHEDASGAVLQERERCARACEDEARLWEADGKGPATEARLCAARIRALA
jgi:hypothetical protein